MRVRKDLLLARGRDRLETQLHSKDSNQPRCAVSYSLGDAIDWKQDKALLIDFIVLPVSYSLGDAIDWKQSDYCAGIYLNRVSYSLGDAIDWKLVDSSFVTLSLTIPLLARGRDRLETSVSGNG